MFGDKEAPTAADVEANWHDIKVAEKGRNSPIEGVPLNMPALALAAKLIDRRNHSGAQVPVEQPDVPADLDEELLGLILLGLVSAARKSGLDPEAALRRGCLTFADALAQHGPIARES